MDGDYNNYGVDDPPEEEQQRVADEQAAQEARRAQRYNPVADAAMTAAQQGFDPDGNAQVHFDNIVQARELEGGLEFDPFSQLNLQNPPPSPSPSSESSDTLPSLVPIPRPLGKQPPKIYVHKHHDAGKVFGTAPNLFEVWRDEQPTWSQKPAKPTAPVDNDDDVDMEDVPLLEILEKHGNARAAKPTPDPLYAPFTSALDWKIGQWMNTRGPSKTSFNEFFKIPEVRHYLGILMVAISQRSQLLFRFLTYLKTSLVAQMPKNLIQSLTDFLRVPHGSNTSLQFQAILAIARSGSVTPKSVYNPSTVRRSLRTACGMLQSSITAVPN